MFADLTDIHTRLERFRSPPLWRKFRRVMQNCPARRTPMSMAVHLSRQFAQSARQTGRPKKASVNQLLRGKKSALASVLLLICLSGCLRAPHSPSIKTTWVDFNIYGRPALFFDHKYHTAPFPQHVKHYRWQHPHSGSAMLPPLSGKHVFDEVSSVPATMPADSAFANNSVMLAPPAEVRQQPANPFDPSLHNLQEPSEIWQEKTKSSIPETGLTPDQSFDSEPFPAPPLPGPTASQQRQSQIPAQQAAWQNPAPRLPSTGTLFARP